MKQHITEKQLSELEPIYQKQLGDYFYPSEGGYFKNSDSNYPESLLLSIGQMIEFLDDSITNNFNIDFKQLVVHYKNVIYPFTDNLCDALWEAVKHKLWK